MAHWPEAASAASVAQPADESAERRYARDGKAYTFEEFALYYGERYGRAIWDKSPCLDKAEQPVPKAAPKSSATRPVHEESITWHLEDIVSSTPKDKLQVSRDNVTMALATILQSYSQKRVVATDSSFAVNITATSVFPWDQWLRNVVEREKLISSGIVKVFALCETSVLEAQIVFCHPDDTYTCAKPGKWLQYEERRGWRDCSTFVQAPFQTVSWMQIREQQLTPKDLVMPLP